MTSVNLSCPILGSTTVAEYCKNPVFLRFESLASDTPAVKSSLTVMFRLSKRLLKVCDFTWGHVRIWLGPDFILVLVCFGSDFGRVWALLESGVNLGNHRKKYILQYILSYICIEVLFLAY